MKLLVAMIITVFLFTPVFSFGQMEKHMKDHTGNGMDHATQNAEDKDAKKDHASGAWHIREVEEAGVKVKVTYKNPGKGKGKGPVFEVVLDTHSVDLEGYKFDEIIVLRDGTGREYHATLVSSSGSGHHREGVVEFKDAVLSASETIELVVEGVAGVGERVFRFEVKR